MTCVTCKRPFPANGELAAIPDGRKVAFDELRHRTWRICGQCGTWNLLGSEATAAALPELLARYAAGTPEMNAGIGVVHLGSKLDLVRIDDSAVEAAGDAAIAKRRRTVSWLARVGLVGIALPVLTWLWAAHVLLTGPRDVLLPGIGACLTLVCGTAFVERCWALRYGVPVRRAVIGVLGGGLLTGIAIEMFFRGVIPARGALVVVAAAGVGAVLFGSLFAIATGGRRKLRDGTTLWLNRYQTARLTISWIGDELSLNDLPGGRTIVGLDAAETIRLLLGASHRRVSSAMSEAAHQLVRTTGGLSGLLLSLDGWREDHGGRVVIADLPAVYRLALDFALAQRAAGIDGHTAIREQADEATIVASEAEALDEPA